MYVHMCRYPLGIGNGQFWNHSHNFGLPSSLHLQPTAATRCATRIFRLKQCKHSLYRSSSPGPCPSTHFSVSTKSVPPCRDVQISLILPPASRSSFVRSSAFHIPQTTAHNPATMADDAQVRLNLIPAAILYPRILIRIGPSTSNILFSHVVV